MGGTIKGAQFPWDKSKSGRQREQDHLVEQSPRWPAAGQSVQKVNGSDTHVEFEGVKERDARGSTPRQLATISYGTCDCDDTDVDIAYRMCCITVGRSPSLFDMGANASYVIREVAAWIKNQAGEGRQQGGKKRGWEAERSTTVSIAGTSMSNPIFGGVVFDLTFLNEVSKQYETIKDIHPHAPQKRRRPHVELFATHPLTDGTNLIPRNALLDAMEDDDDIEWPKDPRRAEPESPDELLAMIQFAGTPALQEALTDRHQLCCYSQIWK